VTVDPPHGQNDTVRTERAVPRERVVVIRVDERAVDVEKRGTYVRVRSRTPAAKCSNISVASTATLRPFSSSVISPLPSIG
jgi:hypothetical protein